MQYQSSGTYSACPAPSGTSATITAAKWNGDSPATFGGSTDNGLQRLTIVVKSDRVSETVVILKRRT